MKLLTKSIYDKLLRNGRINAERALAGDYNIDLPPVVKLFTPDAACTWLLTELDPDDPDIAFGLCARHGLSVTQVVMCAGGSPG